MESISNGNEYHPGCDLREPEQLWALLLPLNLLPKVAILPLRPPHPSLPCSETQNPGCLLRRPALVSAIRARQQPEQEQNLLSILCGDPSLALHKNILNVRKSLLRGRQEALNPKVQYQLLFHMSMFTSTLLQVPTCSSESPLQPKCPNSRKGRRKGCPDYFQIS